MDTMELRTPTLDDLPQYADALRRGWSPNTTRDEVRFEHLENIERDPTAFIASLDDPEAKGPPIRLPDGSFLDRLPGFHRWLWDGDFCGDINLRWQSGTAELPPTCLGHIGYSVVPWKRRRGYATLALGLLLLEAREIALPYVDLTTDESNEASQRVILANGGIIVERFFKGAEYGGTEGLRFRIPIQRT